MTRRKKTEPVSAPPASTKTQYKRYWVDVINDDYEIIASLVVPWDAPVRVTDFGTDPVLKSISECESWNELQMFHDGRWQSVKLQDPPKRYTVQVEFSESRETNDPEEKVLADLRVRYGSKAKVTLLKVEELAEIA